jgi:hypothetical protein
MHFLVMKPSRRMLDKIARCWKAAANVADYAVDPLGGAAIAPQLIRELGLLPSLTQAESRS